jgi:hypothetical protein
MCIKCPAKKPGGLPRWTRGPCPALSAPKLNTHDGYCPSWQTVNRTMKTCRRSSPTVTTMKNCRRCCPTPQPGSAPRPPQPGSAPRPPGPASTATGWQEALQSRAGRASIGQPGAEITMNEWCCHGDVIDLARHGCGNGSAVLVVCCPDPILIRLTGRRQQFFIPLKPSAEKDFTRSSRSSPAARKAAANKR